MSFFSTVVVNKLFHCSVQHAKQVTEYQNRKPQKSSLRGRRKKGRERGGTPATQATEKPLSRYVCFSPIDCDMRN